MLDNRYVLGLVPESFTTCDADKISRYLYALMGDDPGLAARINNTIAGACQMKKFVGKYAFRAASIDLEYGSELAWSLI